MFDIEVVTRHVNGASEAMQWGADDCCMFVRNIVLDCGGPDLFEGRLLFKRKSECLNYLHSYGGLVRLAILQADSIGLKQIERPFQSDAKLVGIVPTKHGPALALRVNGKWIVRGEHGVAIHNDDMCVIAWEIPNA